MLSNRLGLRRDLDQPAHVLFGQRREGGRYPRCVLLPLRDVCVRLRLFARDLPLQVPSLSDRCTVSVRNVIII